MEDKEKKVVIIGAGPAGLSCAYYLLKYTDIKPIILEESEYIGGISRTHNHNGNRMDLGGHRFFTKCEEVMNLWTEILPVKDAENDDNVLMKRHRISRIYFLKKFFDYPISFKAETFLNLGFVNVFKSGIDYIYSALYKRKENSLEDFYINRFGRTLYRMFFEDYTKKVWGIHPKDIAPDWGKQRVKGLSLIGVLKNALLKPFIKKDKVETSLIEEFLYPKFGPGQLYEKMAERIFQMGGGKIYLNNKVIKINFDENKITSVITLDENGNENLFEADTVFSSMPIKDLINSFNQPVNDEVKEIAKNLPYRDFMTLGLLVNKLQVKDKLNSKLIPDCWIYIQEREVKLGRLQIFNNWSPYLVKDNENTVWLGLEYFCSEGDSLWNMDDKDFIELASEELSKIGIIDKNDILDSVVIRVKKAYPAYFGSYKNFDKVKNYLNTIDNLYCIGRNGQHRYNNMDHSILTGIEAVKAFLSNGNKEKVWSVNTENEYHEEK